MSRLRLYLSSITLLHLVIPLAASAANMPQRHQRQDAPPPFNYTTDGRSVTITGYTGPGGNVIIPQEIGKLPVTEIADAAFFDCESMTNVTFPDGIKSIGNATFQYCINLTHVALPRGLRSTGDWTFYGCDNLASVSIPHGVTNIGFSTFRLCARLRNITIPDSVITIDPEAFCSCVSLTSIAIPDTVVSLGTSAFGYCPSLKAVYFQGNAPIADGMVFWIRTVTAYYLPDTTGWAEFSANTGIPTKPLRPEHRERNRQTARR
jgi:hypothetical protein